MFEYHKAAHHDRWLRPSHTWNLKGSLIGAWESLEHPRIWWLEKTKDSRSRMWLVSRSLEGSNTLLLHSLEGFVCKMHYNYLVDHLVLWCYWEFFFLCLVLWWCSSLHYYVHTIHLLIVMKLREWFCTLLASMIGMSHTYLWTNIETRVNQYRNKVELYYPKTNIKLVT